MAYNNPQCCNSKQETSRLSFLHKILLQDIRARKDSSIDKMFIFKIHQTKCFTTKVCLHQILCHNNCHQACPQGLELFAKALSVLVAVHVFLTVGLSGPLEGEQTSQKGFGKFGAPDSPKIGGFSVQLSRLKTVAERMSKADKRSQPSITFCERTNKRSCGKISPASRSKDSCQSLVESEECTAACLLTRALSGGRAQDLCARIPYKIHRKVCIRSYQIST